MFTLFKLFPESEKLLNPIIMKLKIERENQKNDTIPSHSKSINIMILIQSSTNIDEKNLEQFSNEYHEMVTEKKTIMIDSDSIIISLS